MRLARGSRATEDGSMQRLVAMLALAVAALAPVLGLAQDGLDGQPGMGEPAAGFDHLTRGEPRERPGEAIRRDRFDEIVARMAAEADSNRDQMVTLAEFRAVIAARK